jgi:O-antigen/teichoic acid export membrane protein
MRRLFVRRSATAVGIYLSVVLGFIGTIVAGRELSVREFGEYSTVVFAVAFIGSFFDLTVEEALVKYGFHYVAREDWSRLRQLYRSALGFKVVGTTVGGIALLCFGLIAHGRLGTALLVAAPLPFVQSLQGYGGTALLLQERYDLRGAFLAWSMLLRLVGIGVGAHYGVVEAVAGLVVGQIVATASVGVAGRLAFNRFPQAPRAPLGEDRRGIVSFILQSSASTGVTSLQSGLAPLLLGAVTSTTQVGYFKIAQAPQSALLAVSAPVRIVQLTEQTRDWERGQRAAVLTSVRRYSLVAFGLMIVVVPPLLYLMPSLVKLAYGDRYGAAAGAARVFLLVAAIQFVLGWTKSFPVAVGRPSLRIVTHGTESLTILPLVFLLGHLYGAVGAAFAVLAGMCVFAAVWFVIFRRITVEDVGPPQTVREAEALEATEAEALLR